MINHLKEIHRKLYLPSITASTKRSYTVRSIDEPYLYADSFVYVDKFDDLRQTVSIPVYNVGGGTLKVNSIDIESPANVWLKRKGHKVSLPAELSAQAAAFAVELTLSLRDLPQPLTVHSASLSLNSNSVSDAFSKVQLEVRPPDDEAPILKGPSYINFREIGAWKVSLIDAQQEDSRQVDFYLVGDFDQEPPTRFHLKQIGERTFHARFFTKKRQLHYDLDLDAPGTVAPRTKNKRRSRLKSTRKKVSVANLSKENVSAKVTASVEWLNPSSKIQIEAASTKRFTLFVKAEHLQLGRNFGWLTICPELSSGTVEKAEVSQKASLLNQKIPIPVWAWHVIKGNIGPNEALTLKSDTPDLDYELDLSTPDKSLPLEVSPDHHHDGSFMLFEDATFRFPLVREDRNGYLLGDFNHWAARSLMLDQRQGIFEATLSISDGIYLYRAEIDGEMRLDPLCLNKVICCSEGVASRMRLARREQALTIRHRADEKLRVQLRSSVEWFSIKPTSLVLQPHGEADIRIIREPSQMQPGLNLGFVEIETQENPRQAHRFPVTAMGRTNGVVPLLRQTEFEFPPFQKGQPYTIPLELNVVGSGELKGELQPSTVLKFVDGSLLIQNEEEFVQKSVAPLVSIRGDRLSSAHRKQCKAFLITNCYLANRRVLPLTFRYQMIHLEVEPPALYFPEVFLFDRPQHISLAVNRRDGKAVSLTIEIPSELRRNGFLTLTDELDSTKQEFYEFTLNPQGVSSPGTFTGWIQIRDQTSGITQPLWFATDIIASPAKIRFETPKKLANPKNDGIPLSITNVGQSDLKIFDLKFCAHQFYCVPRLPKNTILPSGETIQLLLKVRQNAKLFRRTTVRDTIVIRLSDARYPSGRWEREFEAIIPARILGLT